MNGNSRRELDELLGAYALDAIEPVERFEMDQYLSQNREARREVDELRETAALLALLHVQREPVPEHVWDDIQSAIHDHDVLASHTADVITLRDEQRADTSRRRRAVPLPVAALLVAAAAIAIVLLAARNDTNNSGRSTAAAFQHAVEQQHGHSVAIVGKSGTLAHVVQTSEGAGYLRSDHMPALPAGKVYQLWVVAPGQKSPISAGVLGRKPKTYATFTFQGHPQAYAISVENAPGAIVPSTPIGEGAT